MNCNLEAANTVMLTMNGDVNITAADAVDADESYFGRRYVCRGTIAAISYVTLSTLDRACAAPAISGHAR